MSYMTKDVAHTLGRTTRTICTMIHDGRLQLSRYTVFDGVRKFEFDDIVLAETPQQRSANAICNELIINGWGRI